jgi:hypothetical protein
MKLLAWQRWLTAALAVWVARIDSPARAADVSSGADELGAVLVVGERIEGPDVSETGAADYRLGAQQIAEAPRGSRTTITDVLAQMPGVAFDQNQQIHIRSTEGPQFQYQIDGLLVPLDINTNPPFVSMLNAAFISQLDLELGVLPARDGYATGGVVEIQSKEGCAAPGGEVSLEAGQRSTFAPSIEYAACDGPLSSYLSARATWSDTAFSSATPGPTPIHDSGRTPQALGFWSYSITPRTRVTLLLAATRSDNELPDAPGLLPRFRLAGVAQPPGSEQVDSRLDFRDTLAMAALRTGTDSGATFQVGLTGHWISQQFVPDATGELIYQGVASHALHADRDQSLQADLRLPLGAHTLGAGLYVADYFVRNVTDSQVFPADAQGAQLSDTPVVRDSRSEASNILASLYVDDRWQFSPRASVNLGLRVDNLTGYTHATQLSPRLNLLWRPDAAAAWHLGVARYLQVPSLLGIAPGTPTLFAGTSAQAPPGVTLPVAEDDWEVDGGVVLQPTAALRVSMDAYYEWTRHYLDTGQFGVVPIFAPFNFEHGALWGTELALQYAAGRVRAYGNLTLGENWQRGVATGQFNFEPAALDYIQTHDILLDHQPKFGATAGLALTPALWTLSLDGRYSSGLATGFANTRTLPQTLQFDAGVERRWVLAGSADLALRLTVLDLLDRINLIRSADGIGIFQAAYAPRRTVLGTVSLRF